MSILIALLTGGGPGTYLTTWQTNRFARQRDQAAHAHELAITAEARRQDRLERAYTELGIYLA